MFMASKEHTEKMLKPILLAPFRLKLHERLIEPANWKEYKTGTKKVLLNQPPSLSWLFLPPEVFMSLKGSQMESDNYSADFDNVCGESDDERLLQLCSNLYFHEEVRKTVASGVRSAIMLKKNRSNWHHSG